MTKIVAIVTPDDIRDHPEEESRRQSTREFITQNFLDMEWSDVGRISVWSNEYVDVMTYLRMPNPDGPDGKRYVDPATGEAAITNRRQRCSNIPAWFYECTRRSS